MIEIPMTDAQFAATQKALAEAGMDASGPTGTLSRQGVTANYAWDGTKFTIEVTDHPRFLPLSMIESKLKDLVHEKMRSA
ncbi:hypothetical protein [Bryocella elongata]|nr:hypothetical protein [Bryocella elongata]